MQQNQANSTNAGINHDGGADAPAHVGGLLRSVYDLFSSVWFGVILLTLLFIYSSIGSAIPPVRQLRIFEMTEYEWFHYWPFNTLIALICINIIVTTLRRIRFKPVNYGVWMIHTGIIILCAGSVWYFGTKVEGESIVPRRNVVLSLPNAEPVTFVARPGNVASIENDSARYFVQVASIDPAWELLSGDDKGRKTYAVTLNIQRATTDSTQEQGDEAENFGQTFSFMRQIIAGFPQYTEDIIRTDDHTQPMKRAKKINADGNPLVDETFAAALEYSPEEYFYLVNSAALYLREVSPDGRPKTGWIERPIKNLPRYHDYISDIAKVWPASDDPNPQAHPIDIRVSADKKNSDDPFADGDIVITDYLRYAMTDTRRMPGGDELNPAVSFELSAPDGRRATYELVAFDSRRSMAENGRLLFMWAESEKELDDLRNAPGPRLAVTFPETSEEVTFDLTSVLATDPDAPYVAVGESGYSVRAERLENNLQLQDGTLFSIAVLQVRKPDGTEYRRIAHADPAQPNVDFPLEQVVTGHEQPQPLDEKVRMTYLPSPRPAQVTIIGGPDEKSLHVLHSTDAGETLIEPAAQGQSLEVDSGLTLRVIRFASRTHTESRPAIIPQNRRNRDAGEQFSMVRVDVPVQRMGTSTAVESMWLPFHLFPFENERLVLRRFRFEPKRFVIDDRGTEDTGDDRTIEILFSRQRSLLPAPVVLDDFILTTHTGGYTGDAAIRNWTSVVRFADDASNTNRGPADSTWSSPLSVSVNDPIELDGYWFFQSRWDPPDPPVGPNDSGSAGFNHTVLGVGNRKGVNIMLAGCCIAVLGMIYAFYIKPHIKRRKMLFAQSLAEAHAAAHAKSNGELTPSADDLEQTFEPAEFTSPRVESRS